MGEREIQTDGERNRPTQESSAWFTAGFVGDPVSGREIRRPSWTQGDRRKDRTIVQTVRVGTVTNQNIMKLF